MKGFDYLNAKRQMTPTEEAFREAHAKERERAQAELDSVLYSDAAMRDKPNTDTANDKKADDEQQVEAMTEGVQEVAADPVEADEQPSEASEQKEAVKSDSYSLSGMYRDGSDEDFEDDAEENVSEYDPTEDIGSDDVETIEEQVETEPVGSDVDSGYPDTDDEAELARREAEAELRKRTAAANNKNRPKAKPAKKSAATDGDTIPMSVLKKFPSGLAYHIKSLFPEARTMDEAVAAYVYLKEGEPSDIQVPYEIKKLAKGYIGDSVTPKDVQDELMKEIYKLREYNTKFMKKLNSVELAVSYALFDRLGFRKANALTPGELNFLEAGISDLVKQLEKQSEIKQNRDSQRQGRPIK
jgi:hypothetical protein